VIENDPIPKQNIELHRLNMDDYFSELVKFNRSPHTDINLAEFHVLSKTDKVTNGGAGPCLILYYFDEQSSEVISGHFPQTSGVIADRNKLSSIREAQAHLTDPQLKLTEAEKISQLSSSLSYDLGTRSGKEYDKMLKTIRERIQRGSKGELFLFGQNALLHSTNTDASEAELIAELTDNSIRRFDVTSDLLAAGAAYSQIHDLREPRTISNISTSTFFSEETGLVYTVYEIPKVDEQLSRQNPFKNTPSLN
jgi:hypothetical protein